MYRLKRLLNFLLTITYQIFTNLVFILDFPKLKKRSREFPYIAEEYFNYKDYLQRNAEFKKFKKEDF